MHQRQRIPDYVNRYVADQHRLHEKQSLNDYAEHRVGDEFADALHEQRTPSGVAEGRVRYVLKCFCRFSDSYQIVVIT